MKTAAAALIALTLTGCASTSEEERARAARVRVVNRSEVVQGCEPIGTVTDDSIQDLQKKAAQLGGDIALVTMQSQRGSAGRLRTYTTAEVYQCGSKR